MLLYFILGIIFVSVVLPVIENLLSCMSAWSEYVNYVFALKIYKIKEKLGVNVQIEENKNSKSPMGFQQTNCIGFEIPKEDIEEGEQ